MLATQAAADFGTIVPLEEVRRVALSQWRERAIVTLGFQCSSNLQVQFFETLQVGDTICTKTPETVWPALERFPLQASDAGAADVDRDGNNHRAGQELDKFLASDEPGRQFRRTCLQLPYLQCKRQFEKAKAREQLNDFEQKRKRGNYVSPADFAQAYLQLGETQSDSVAAISISGWL